MPRNKDTRMDEERRRVAGHNVSQLVVEDGRTCTVIAPLMGIDRKTLYKAMRTRYWADCDLSVSHAVAFADFFGVPVDVIVGRTRLDDWRCGAC